MKLGFRIIHAGNKSTSHRINHVFKDYNLYGSKETLKFLANIFIGDKKNNVRTNKKITKISTKIEVFCLHNSK